MDTILLDIDGVQVEHQLDDNGNATLDGEIKFTKEQLTELNNDPIVEPDNGGSDNEVTFSTIAQASGITILGTDGNPREYEMTTEGFANWGKDIHATGYKQGVDNALSDIFSQHPDLEDMYRYKLERGTLEGYVVKPKIGELTVDDTTDAGVLWEIIYSAEIAQGKSPERAKKIADFSKNNESLKEDAEDSLNYLKDKEAKTIEANRIAAEKAAKEAALAEEQWYGVTYDNKGKEKVLNIDGSMYDLVVNKGTVGDLLIPAAGIKVKVNGQDKLFTRKDIFDYMSKPVKEVNGVLVTQAQLDEYNRMQDKKNVTKQFLLNLVGSDAAGILLNRAVTQKVIKVVKANVTVPGGKGGVTTTEPPKQGVTRNIVLPF